LLESLSIESPAGIAVPEEPPPPAFTLKSHPDKSPSFFESAASPFLRPFCDLAAAVGAGTALDWALPLSPSLIPLRADGDSELRTDATDRSEVAATCVCCALGLAGRLDTFDFMNPGIKKKPTTTPVIARVIQIVLPDKPNKPLS
jgi:hypothetical protein